MRRAGDKIRLMRRNLFAGDLDAPLRSGRNRRQHILLALNQRSRIVTGGLKAVPVGNRIGGARLYAIAAEDTAVVIDVVDAGVALAAGDSRGFGVFGRFN